jgi:protein TonB
MKQLGVAAFLAALVHALLFWVEIPWAGPTLAAFQSRSMRIDLVTIEKTAPKPAPEVATPAPQPELKKKPAPKPVARSKAIQPPIPKTGAPAAPYKTTLSAPANIAPLAPLEEVDPIPIDKPVVTDDRDVLPEASPMATSGQRPSEIASAYQAGAISKGDVTPQKLYTPLPDYPPLAKRRGCVGTVLLRLLVSKDGRVAEAKVLQSSGYSILDRSAVDFIQRKWRFAPARKEGHTVDMWVELPVHYELN